MELSSSPPSPSNPGWAGRGDNQSHRTESNCRPLDYESRALPLSYGGGAAELRGNALARIRTGTDLSTAPSRQRVYQFHHQGLQEAVTPCAVGTYWGSEWWSSSHGTLPEPTRATIFN